MTQSRSLLPRMIATAALLAATSLPLPAAAVTYLVSVDTTGISGQAGLLDFQFNPGGATSPAASAVVSAFSGAVPVGVPTLDGDVEGALPAAQTFRNTTAFNASLQGVTFGSTISFLLTFSGAFETASAGDGTAFALGVLNPELAPLIGSDPVSGASLVFDLFPGAAPTFTAYDSGTAVSEVPEPGTYALVLAGLLLLLLANGRSRGVARPSRRRIAPSLT